MLASNSYGAAEAGMKAQKAAQRGTARSAHRRILASLVAMRRLVAPLLAALLLLWPLAAIAADQAQIIATEEQGFGRLVINFPDRMDLPTYRVKYDNGVLAIEFDSPIKILLPDIAVLMPNYATVARADPDGKGIRIGLRTGFNLNRLEAGEKLYIDLMPLNWQGLPPALPPEIVAQLADRAKKAAELAEAQAKAEEAKRVQPVATVRLGRNPTFVRLQFDWNVDTEAKFAFRGTAGTLDFDWPVPIDLYALKADLPKEFKGATNSVSALGSRVAFSVADGVTPRFYQLTPRQFVVDIDVSTQEGLKAALAAEDAQKKAKAEADAAAAEEESRKAARLGMQADDTDGTVPAAAVEGGPVIPHVTNMGGTIRVAFPFDHDTAAAVFRRGDTVWMVFDTNQDVQPPSPADALSAIASNVEVVAAGDTKVVRMDLSADRLATLGSEGRSWVLSLGDVLLNATEPITLSRQRDQDGLFEMNADIQHPGKVHVLRDPIVGDTLRVVTVMPPAKGLTRDLQYVDFAALKSAHGLVIEPHNSNLDVSVEDDGVLISAGGGLTLSNVEASRVLDAGNAPEFRDSYLDLDVLHEDDPGALQKREQDIMGRAATTEGRLRDVARLDLAQFYLANQLSYEALGVLDVLGKDLTNEDLRKKVQLSKAIADTMAARPADALSILNGGSFGEESDALMWRTIARSDSGDYKGARLDAISSEGVFPSYPLWVRNKFLFAALRAAVETRDEPLSLRLIGKLEFPKLVPEEVSLYQLMQGRIAELENHDQEALDTYGQVIAADVRPTRAEAVYRTLLLLQKAGKIDLKKATETLAAEALLWRGGPLEADMDKLLAELYFANKDYRQGFDTVRQVAAAFPSSQPIGDLIGEAQKTFEQLYLNGGADVLSDLDALSLYYDFRQLTPPGTRGDEMIRNLARRLVKVDLLPQAADLLEYQIKSRLDGIAKAQVAADLAMIRIANRDPEAALRAINETRIAELPPQLERQRRILEARALIDSGRQDLAIDLISRLQGRDADLLRVDGYWKSKNYSRAADLLEVMYSPVDTGPQMTQQARLNVVKAAVGYVLAGDKLGISRLRSKFSTQLANSAEWPLFDYVTQEIAPTSPEFKKVAQQVAGLDSLDAFLTSYRELYASQTSMVPNAPKAPNAA
jgi:hypothetical protein